VLASNPQKGIWQKVSDILTLSPEELSRAQVMQQLDDKRIKQRHASEQLGLSIRQVKRLLQAYRRDGAKALVSKQRGRQSNHQLNPHTKQEAVGWLQRRYADFGPTLAHEKLTEVHGLDVGCETVRQLMIAGGLWQPKRTKKPVMHPLRERRARFGELVQIDGSPYAWFEERAPACTLLVFIDDATGRLGELYFTAAETTFSYFEASERYLLHHGKPLSLYSDKYSVFRINLPNDLSGTGTTQFGRAMRQLGIEVICANTPQAKGRVERVMQTLQDRLVKEMRLRGISSIAEGNAYAPEFMEDFNGRFAVVPRDPADAHRALLPQDDLTRILTVQEMRVLSKNLTLQYNKVIYQIQTARPTYALRNAQVVVRENRLGEIAIEYKGKPLQYTVYREQVRQAEVVPSKQIALALEPLTPPQKKRKPYVPPADHPWRRFQLGKPKHAPSNSA
jgi:transposase